MILGKYCVFRMDERGHGVGHVHPLEWSERTAMSETQGNTCPGGDSLTFGTGMLMSSNFDRPRNNQTDFLNNPK